MWWSKKKIEAVSKLSAADILKSKQEETGNSKIRIDSIERMNPEETIKKKKKKRSMIALFAITLIFVASLSRLAEKLF